MKSITEIRPDEGATVAVAFDGVPRIVVSTSGDDDLGPVLSLCDDKGLAIVAIPLDRFLSGDMTTFKTQMAACFFVSKMS